MREFLLKVASNHANSRGDVNYCHPLTAGDSTTMINPVILG